MMRLGWMVTEIQDISHNATKFLLNESSRSAMAEKKRRHLLQITWPINISALTPPALKVHRPHCTRLQRRHSRFPTCLVQRTSSSQARARHALCLRHFRTQQTQSSHQGRGAIVRQRPAPTTTNNNQNGQGYQPIPYQTPTLNHELLNTENPMTLQDQVHMKE